MIQRKSKELATIGVMLIDEKNNHSLINHLTELRLTPKYFSIYASTTKGSQARPLCEFDLVFHCYKSFLGFQEGRR